MKTGEQAAEDEAQTEGGTQAAESEGREPGGPGNAEPGIAPAPERFRSVPKHSRAGAPCLEKGRASAADGSAGGPARDGPYLG